MKILDSDHCVAILRGQLDVQHHAGAQELLGVTGITVGELSHGAQHSQHAKQNLARVEVLLAAVMILPFDEFAARRFGALKAQLESHGTRLADLDLQIAAICLQTNSTLVTHNLRHFGRITSLRCEDWLA
ncbi:MAG: type II toxin-antitoxin system VapC family toxin [Anaerolineales bacterium]|nr:type II toxin-antitoxin system VapC family toxin [Anaerolineales bacterium]